MNQKESEYFAELLRQKEKAKEEAQKYVEELKILVSEENRTAKKIFLFKNCIIHVSVYFNSDYTSIGVNFIDYIKAHGGETKEILKRLYEEAKTPLKQNFVIN